LGASEARTLDAAPPRLAAEKQTAEGKVGGENSIVDEEVEGWDKDMPSTSFRGQVTKTEEKPKPIKLMIKIVGNNHERNWGLVRFTGT